MTSTVDIRRRGPAARNRILEAAKRLFDAQGINATGMEQVAASAPVSKRTLYAHFPGKEDLTLAYLTYLGQAKLTVEAVLDREDMSPRDRLLSLFSPDAAADGPLRGCPFIDAAVEFPDPGSPVHAYAAQQKRRFGQRLAELARDAGAADADFVGEQLALLSDGLSSRAMVLNDAGCSRYALAIAESLIDSAIDRARHPHTAREN